MISCILGQIGLQSSKTAPTSLYKESLRRREPPRGPLLPVYWSFSLPNSLGINGKSSRPAPCRREDPYRFRAQGPPLRREAPPRAAPSPKGHLMECHGGSPSSGAFPAPLRASRGQQRSLRSQASGARKGWSLESGSFAILSAMVLWKGLITYHHKQSEVKRAWELG